MQRLTGIVRNYAWGDAEAIPGLLGVEPDGRPQAELWLGAHPQSPAILADGRTLDDAIAADPAGMLGPRVADRFGELPFLPKVLAAASNLSIQTHPDLETARAGFAREEAEGIPRDAPHRTYRDQNHKPELLCALTPFVALCGFRDLEATRALFDRIGGASLAPVRAMLGTEGTPADALAATLSWLLHTSADRIVEMIAAAWSGLVALDDDATALERRWLPVVAQANPGDVGVLVALLLNHVELEPGDALFLGPGNLHAYLHGVGVEVMANSDNVIRGGLTAKHIDTAELSRIVDTTPFEARVQRPSDDGLTIYRSPVPEFSLVRRVRSHPDDAGDTAPAGPSVFLVTDGRFRLDPEHGPSLGLGAGEAAFASAADGAVDIDGEGTVFHVGVGAL